MRESGLQAVVLFAGFILLAFLLLMRPGYLANPAFLGTIVVAQIVIASVCKYKQWFFMILLAAFFWAGMALPLSEAWLEGRWVVLAVGSFAGLAIYLRNRSHKFNIVHLFALFCVLSAIVSASVSTYPQEALLKSLSLFLLFLYGTTGARLASSTLEQSKLFARFLAIAEATVYVTAIAYFGLRQSIFGNPNSLGAVMGIIVIPILMWGYLAEESIIRKRRFGFELCLAIALLMSSFSRAGIAAALISCLLLCLTARRYRLIVGGVIALVAISVLVVIVVPPPVQESEDAHSESIASIFLYKGKPQEGILGSRKGPWDATLAVIKQHPWFGSGFGTSMTDLSANYFDLTRARFVDSRMVREHGNSYLAIMEWSGLLGVCPFYLLILATAWQARRALVSVRRTGNIYSPAVPAAAVVVAGFIGATFEDWLFAVGYHVSVFFWAMAFILPDLMQPMAEAYSEETTAIENREYAMPAAS